MEEDVGSRPSVASLFVERFDDFFEHGVHPAIALGFMLTWIWMGLTEGYPIFMNGLVDLPSVVILLVSFAGALFALGFVRASDVLLHKPAIWIAVAVAVGGVCLALLAVYFGMIPLEASFAKPLIVRLAMVVLGLGAGLLVLCCATSYARLRPVSAGIGFAFAVSITFAVYFCLNVCGTRVGGVLFCLLPPLASLMLFRERVVIVERLRLWPEEKLPFAKGFVSMCVSFGVFFFAIGTKCAFEPTHEFAVASDTSVIGVLAVSLVFLYAIGLRSKPVGVFHALKVLYSASVMVLTICIAVAPLSIEPYVGILYNADVMAMMMVLWLLACFVARSNEAYVGHVLSLALGVAALGMALGWLCGTVVYGMLGHDRSYPTIALACATAVFSTIGFSSKSFPLLTRRGEGAKKMMKVAQPYSPELYCAQIAERCHLSGREVEVLALLVAGYGADAVSEKLVISYHTARTHVRNIYKKMDIHSQRELLDSFEAAKAAHEAVPPGA